MNVEGVVKVDDDTKRHKRDNDAERTQITKRDSVVDKLAVATVLLEYRVVLPSGERLIEISPKP